MPISVMIEAIQIASIGALWLVVILLYATHAEASGVGRFSLLMPNVRPYRPELYLCTPVRVDYSDNYYIVGFEPNATMNTAHHMLLYGCGKPGSDKSVWNCGEMATLENDDKNEVASPCSSGSQTEIIYAWARDAPTLILPKDVGFKVGKSSKIQYLVLQVHYASIEKFRDGSTDDSGLFLRYTKKILPKQAGVFILGTAGRIPAMSVEHMESSCRINENKVIHPFAFRVHTHALGKVVTGYRSRNGNWSLLGRRDPLKPQMFYPINSTEPILKGDILAARCTMQSNRNRTTYVGPTGLDEMCNFYLMYYVEDDEPLIQSSCFSSGPPEYYWKNDDTLRNIPDADASQLDNTPDNGTQMHMHMMPTAEQKHTSTTGQAHTNSCSIFLTLLFAASMHITNLVHF